MQVVCITGQVMFIHLSKHSSFEVCDFWIPCYWIPSNLPSLQTSLCLQTQIWFWKVTHQKCSSCMSFIHSVQRMFVWGIKTPYVHNIPLPSGLQMNVIWLQSSRVTWFICCTASIPSLFFWSAWKKAALKDEQEGVSECSGPSGWIQALSSVNSDIYWKHLNMHRFNLAGLSSSIF